MELVSPALVDFVAVVAIITGLSLAAWWAIGLYTVHSRKEEKALPEVELPGHIHEVISGVPPVIAVFGIFIGLSLIAYVLAVWLGGVTY